MKFEKMHGAGNDFILVDARNLEQDWSDLAKAMCHRHFGVGADGLILVLPSKLADFRMRMFNPDGSEAEACGNGLRCFARYVVERGLAEVGKEQLAVETLSGIREAYLAYEKGQIAAVRLGMGIPKLKPIDIPMLINEQIETVLDYCVTIDNRDLFLTCVSMGNPHAVCLLGESTAGFPLAVLGPKVEYHPIFPQRVNFEVASVLSRQRIEARVWERGAGETLACGTGACAIAVATRLHGYVDSTVDIVLPGGRLTVEWDGVGEVFLSGPTEFVFSGEWPSGDG